jgi:hypothetical protein
MSTNPFEDAKVVGKVTNIPVEINKKIKELCDFIRDKIHEVARQQNTYEFRLQRTFAFPNVAPEKSTDLVYGVIIKNLIEKDYIVSIRFENCYAILKVEWYIDKMEEMSNELKKIVNKHLIK